MSRHQTASPAATTPVVGEATSTGQVLQGTEALVVSPGARALFAAYLDRLEVDGYTACPHMAAYIARSRELLTANQPTPSSLDQRPKVVVAPEGGHS